MIEINVVESLKKNKYSYSIKIEENTIKSGHDFISYVAAENAARRYLASFMKNLNKSYEKIKKEKK